MSYGINAALAKLTNASNTIVENVIVLIDSLNAFALSQLIYKWDALLMTATVTDSSSLIK